MQCIGNILKSKARQVTLSIMAAWSFTTHAAPWDRVDYTCTDEANDQVVKLQTTRFFGRPQYRIGDESTAAVGTFQPFDADLADLQDDDQIPDGSYARHDQVFNLLFFMVRDDVLMSAGMLDGALDGYLAIAHKQTMVLSEIYNNIRYRTYYCIRDA